MILAFLDALSHPAHDRAEVYPSDVSLDAQLHSLLDRPVRYFAVPYGLHEHLNSSAFQLALEAGYQGACSAYGGYNFPGDDPFHLQRIHVDDDMVRLKNRTTIDPRKKF